MLLPTTYYIHSMKDLTKRQNEFYQMLLRYFDFNQRFPTQAESSEIMGFSSPNASFEYFKALVRKGKLELKGSRNTKNYIFTEYKAVLTKISQSEV